MFIISKVIVLFIALALAYTYWCVLSSVVKRLQLSWPMASLLIVISLILGGTLATLLVLLFIAGPVNAGSLLGMLLGISLILAGIRTFTC